MSPCREPYNIFKPYLLPSFNAHAGAYTQVRIPRSVHAFTRGGAHEAEHTSAHTSAHTGVQSRVQSLVPAKECSHECRRNVNGLPIDGVVMSGGFTGTDDPLPCEVLRRLPLRNDMCFACFDGVFCNADRTVCQDLTGCKLNGAQTCGFFQTCVENPSMSIDTNEHRQYVASCETDALRVTIFALGCILTVSFLVMMGLIARDHVRGSRADQV